MKLGDIASLDLRHLAAADPGVDEELDRTPAFVGRSRLAVGGDIFVEKPLSESLHSRGLAVGVALYGRVAERPNFWVHAWNSGMGNVGGV